MSRSDILALFEKHGILSTPQRLEVADILLEKPQHLSADQIIDRLREAGSSVSKATTQTFRSQSGIKKTSRSTKTPAATTAAIAQDTRGDLFALRESRIMNGIAKRAKTTKTDRLRSGPSSTRCER